MGAPPSFPAIFELHAAFVWRTLRRLGVAEADVQDVGQEVFVVVNRRLADFDDRSGMRAWIYGICVRCASEQRRRAYVRREKVTDEVPEVAAPADQHDVAERREARRALDEILRDLDDKKREVFVLFELEELSLAEIADAVETPLQTVYSRLQAARASVEQAFARRALREKVR